MPRRRSPARDRFEASLFAGFRRLLRALSGPAAERLGRGLGRLFRLLDARRRRLAQENLSRAFPDLSPRQVRDLARRVFAHFGGLAADLVRSTDEPLGSVLSRVELMGAERAAAAAASGRGVLFLTPHLGNWEVAALATAASGLPVTVIARPLDNALLDVLLTRFREQTGNRVVSKREAAREMLRVLRKGGGIGILPDQHAHPPDAVLVPFFGRPAATTSALARLAERTGALILPASAFRIGPCRYRLVFEEPIDVRTLPEEERTPEALTARINAVVEAMVRRHPDQWLWLHDRWRT